MALICLVLDKTVATVTARLLAISRRMPDRYNVNFHCEMVSVSCRSALLKFRYVRTRTCK